MADVNLKFDFSAREWQKKCFQGQKRFTVLAVHRRAGKTTLATAELVIKAVQTKGLYAYIAPELKQAKIIAWKVLKDMCMQFKKIKVGGSYTDLVEFRESELAVRFWNGAEIRLFGADNPDSMRGTKLAGAVIDEVAQMPKELWLEIVYPALMDSRGWALFIGTPKGINLFSELFDRGSQPAFSKEWAALKFTCYETDALAPEDIEGYKQSVPEEVFKREMLCDFSASGSDNVISLFEAQQASHKNIDPAFVGSANLVMGVDVARFGNDRSVITLRKGLLAEDPTVIKGLDLVQLAGVIKRIYMERRPKAVFIDGTGVGGGVVDMLNSWGIYSNDINFGSKSQDPQYMNRRTEMWFRMADWLRKGGILPPNESLVADLALPTYVVNERNQKQLESKKSIKDRAGRSPDLADSLCLTFAEILPEPEYDCFGQEINHDNDPEYNPVNEFERCCLYGNRNYQTIINSRTFR